MTALIIRATRSPLYPLAPARGSDCGADTERRSPLLAEQWHT
jgi:hypothetical protein